MTDSVELERNIYAPPEARVADAAPVAPGPEFYVVSQRKFPILYVATAGVYGDYWFYRHWKAHKHRHATPTWPIARGLFSIFFAHSLAARIMESLRHWGRAVPPLGTMATLYVASEVALRAISCLTARSIGWPCTDLFSVSMRLPIGSALLQMQRTAKRACGDESGDGNRTFTPTNDLWIALGLLFWVLILFSITLSPEEMASA